MGQNIEFSSKFYLKFFNDTIKVSEENKIKYSWLKTYYEYMIDSKFRKYKELSAFCKEQFDDDLVLKDEAAKFSKLRYDDIVMGVLKHINNKIRYGADIDVFGRLEYWCSAKDILLHGEGDCDDINNLIRTLIVMAGVPNYLIFNCLGDVNVGDGNQSGHYWLIYFNLKHEKWVAVDGTYFTDFTAMKSREEFKLSNTKYKSIWFMFNEYGTYKLR